jgi:hypothetical protein
MYMQLKRGVYYFVTPKTKQWQPLGGDLDKAKSSLETRLGWLRQEAKRLPKEEVMDLRQVPAESYQELVQYGQCINQIYRSAKTGARTRKLEWNISKQDIVNLLLESNGRCALSGIPFSTEKVGKRGVMAWWPSLDRIESREGYTPNNIRIVCCAVNIALWDFGDKALIRIAKGIVENCPISSSDEDISTSKNETHHSEPKFSE